jgi:hypothetical protein
MFIKIDTEELQAILCSRYIFWFKFDENYKFHTNTNTYYCGTSPAYSALQIRITAARLQRIQPYKYVLLRHSSSVFSPTNQPTRNLDEVLSAFRRH